MKRGFTLIEMLCVVVILAILFLVITPKLISLTESSEDNEKLLAEEKIISAAKEYASEYNNNFITLFVNVGDDEIIDIGELLTVGLLKEEDYSSLDDVSGVKVELKAGDVMEYTIEYNE